MSYLDSEFYMEPLPFEAAKRPVVIASLKVRVYILDQNLGCFSAAEAHTVSKIHSSRSRLITFLGDTISTSINNIQIS